MINFLNVYPLGGRISYGYVLDKQFYSKSRRIEVYTRRAAIQVSIFDGYIGSGIISIATMRALLL